MTDDNELHKRAEKYADDRERFVKESRSPDFNNDLDPALDMTIWEAHYHAFMDGFRACQEQQRKWVSVKDRLPEADKLVLCCAIGSLSPTYGWYEDDIDKWCVNDEPEYSKLKIDRISFVTHWMPLPEAPDVEEVR